MSELGSIFEDEPTTQTRRGRDVRVRVEVPQAAFGDPAGFVAPISVEVEQAGERVARAAEADDPDGVRIFLPPTLPEGAVLRLRRQGGRPEAGEGVAGDLLVEVVRVPEPPRWSPGLVAALVLAGALAAAALVAL